VLLAGVMGRQWCDYYFSPLVTFWSLFFYSLHTLGRYAECCIVLQCVAVCCSVLQLVAVCCTVSVAVWSSLLSSRDLLVPLFSLPPHSGQVCSVLQCVAVCCSALQCVAVCCRVWQSVAVFGSVLQCVAVCCRLIMTSLFS